MQIDMVAVLLGLAGGLGLFLFGMRLMSEGLELASGSKLRRLLEVLTSNRLIGVLVGLAVTAVIQSSSATTVMVVGFVNAGLMNLSQAVGVIMGANIGTTVTSVLVSINPTMIAPAAVLGGVVMITFFKKKNVQHIGQIFAGLGILFMGLDAMSGAMEPLRDFEPFINIMQAFSGNPLLAILAGLVVTAIIQSSSASVAILQAMVLSGLIGFKGAVFVLFGQNIGTCVTAILASIGTTKTAKRTAVVHLLFNVIGATIFSLAAYFLPFAETIEKFVPLEWQIAVAHIIFNVVTTLLLLPFANVLVRLANLIVPGKDKHTGALRLEYLDARILKTPTIAVAQALKEVERMAVLARENISRAVDMLREPSQDAMKRLEETEKAINFLNHHITDYLVKINALELQEADSQIIGTLFHVVNDIERVGDHAENIAENAMQNNARLSSFALDEIYKMFDSVMFVFDSALGMFHNQVENSELVQEINATEESIDEMARSFQENNVARLNQHACTSQSSMTFYNVISNLERVADHSTNIAYSVNTK